ncbi:hypothetical protein PUN28_016913 [Cardiocondyla obscurior]|uniref:Uncharacterized protein n=1 Tax=Cardiocondyla obscurior TaxID=286306 RepID=A0AAW2ET43_9HYME
MTDVSLSLWKAISKSYKKNKSLTRYCRMKIVDIVLTHLLNENITLKNDDFEYLATEIVKLFPTENIATYYVPPIPKKASRVGKSIISRGKLVDKYRNKICALNVINEWKGSHLNDNTPEHTESDEGLFELKIVCPRINFRKLEKLFFKNFKYSTSKKRR